MIEKIIDTFFCYLILLNIYIALISTFIALIVFEIFKIEINIPEMLFVFFATASAYSLQRLMKFHKNLLPLYLTKLIRYKTFLFYTIIQTLIAFSLLFLLEIKTVVLLSIPFSLTAMYLFIHPKKNQLTGLRYVPYLKTFIVSAAWIILPMLLVIEKSDSTIFYLVFIVFYIQIWQSCLLFDWRDKKIDEGQIKTIVLALNKTGFKLLWLFTGILITTLLLITGDHLSYAIPLLLIAFALQWIAIIEENRPILQTTLADGSLIFAALSNFYFFST